jgi:hypothetical protein
MSGWLASRRATLLIPSGPVYDPDRKHLYVVLNDPHGSDNTAEVLIVCIMSTPSVGGYDPSCTLFPGEHPFITRGSVVGYQYCRIVKAGLLEAKVASGDFIAKQAFSEDVFGHIITGLMDSPYAAPKYKNFLSKLLSA